MPHVTQADDHVGAGSFGEVRRPVDTTNNSMAGAKTTGKGNSELEIVMKFSVSPHSDDVGFIKKMRGEVLMIFFQNEVY